jgi:hypothetical protein
MAEIHTSKERDREVREAIVLGIREIIWQISWRKGTEEEELEEERGKAYREIECH